MNRGHRLWLLVVCTGCCAAVSLLCWWRANQSDIPELPAGWRPGTARYMQLVEDLDRAKLMIEKKEYESAVRVLRKVIDTYADSPHMLEAHIRLGQVRRAQSQHDLALQHFSKVIEECELTHQVARAWLEVGKTHEARGDSAGALATYQKVIDSFPTEKHVCPASYMQVAKLHKRMGLLHKAKAALERIIRDYPGREREWQIEAEVVLKEVAKLSREQVRAATQEPGVRHLQGEITSHLVLEPGVFTVSDTLSVAAGATLTIEPGVTLRFHLNAGLVVYGALTCVGTTDRPIVFTSACDAPEPFDWNGITFSPESRSSSCSLSHCRIEHASTGVRCDGASPTLTNNTITATGRGAIVLSDQSNATLTGNTIEDNEHDGIRCYRRCRAVVKDNTIKGNRGTGLALSTLCEVTVTKNTIADNGKYGIQCTESSGVELVSNEIVRNGRAGIHCNHSSPKILSNTVDANRGPGVLCQTDSAPFLKANLLRANVGGAILCQKTSSPKVVENRIVDNVAFGICCDTLSSPIITANTISSNRGPGILVKDNCAPKINGNDIIGHRPWAIRNEGTAEIDATSNWWGTTDAGQVAKMIFGASDSVSAGKVRCEPLRGEAIGR